MYSLTQTALISKRTQSMLTFFDANHAYASNTCSRSVRTHVAPILVAHTGCKRYVSIRTYTLTQTALISKRTQSMLTFSDANHPYASYTCSRSGRTHVAPILGAHTGCKRYVSIRTYTLTTDSNTNLRAHEKMPD